MRQLGQRPVVIEAGHRGKIRRVQIGRIFLGYQGICVGRVAYHQHLDSAAGMIVQRFSLRGKYFRVFQQQVLALHARTAWFCADQNRVIGVLEGDRRVGSRDHVMQSPEGAVAQLHFHAFQRIDRRRYFQQLQDDGLVATEHLARGNAKCQLITDLPGGAGDTDSYRIFHLIAFLRARKRGADCSTGCRNPILWLARKRWLARDVRVPRGFHPVRLPR